MPGRGGEPAADAGWAEVVYLLVARYGMPSPAEVADDFRRHRQEHGEEVPAIACIRRNVDAEGIDLAGITGGETSSAEIRRYFREILLRYDALEP